MKIRDIVAIVAVALAAGGCNQQDDGLQQDERVPILLKTSIEGTATGLTRAAGDWGERTSTTLTQGKEFLNGEHVFAYIKENDGTHTSNIKWPIEYEVVNDGDDDADDGDLDPVSDTTPFFFPIGVNKINIHAIHPSYTTGTGFTVNTDQTTETNYALSDLCYSMPTDYTRTGNGTDIENGRRKLQFKHLLSKIVVNLTVDASAATNAPSYISLHAKTTTAMTYPIYSNDAGASADDKAKGYTGCTPTDASNPGIIKMIQEAIIPPQTIAAGASFISMNVPGIGPMIYPMPATTTFHSGMKYTYNIKVTDTRITADTDITPWNTPTSSEIVLGKLDWDIRKNPLWYVAEYNLASDNSFSKTMSTSQGQLFIWSNAKGRGYVNSTTEYDGWAVPTTPKTVVNETDGVTWHIPTHREFLSIIPYGGTGITGTGRGIFNNSDIQPGSIGVITEQGCTFGYNNDTKYYNKTNNTNTSGISYDSYWSSYVASSNVRYAIRFLGTPYCSVWRYRIVDLNTVYARLEISARLINKVESDATVALSSLMTEIMSKDDSSSPGYDAHYWDENIGIGAVQRVFYACGYNYSTGEAVAAPGLDSGNNGWYWTTTIATSTTLYRLGWKGGGDWLLIGDNNGGHNFSVRLFRDN